MKIAVVLDDGLDKPDGVQQCVLALNHWLTKQGHEVHYLVGETNRTDLPNLHVMARNVKVSFNGNQLTIPLPVAQRRLVRVLEAIQPDVMHVHAPYSPFMGAKAIRAARPDVGIVGSFHILPYGRVARLATRLLGMWLRPTLRRFQAMYAGSQASADFATWSMRIPVGMIPHSIDIQPFKAAKQRRLPTSKVRIVFLGRLVPRKGALQLVQAIAELPESMRERIVVQIGGRGPLLSEIQALITRSNLDTTIQLDGFIDEADKPAYLAAADIAVFPSISGESFGISLIEPIAAGAGVVVGGDNPGYRSILGYWPETLVDPLDTTRFAQQLERLIADSALRKRLHTAQQAAINIYDVNHVGKRWLKEYHKAIEAARRNEP